MTSTQIAAWNAIEGYDKSQLHPASIRAELASGRSHAFEPYDENIRKKVRIGFGQGMGTIADLRLDGSFVLNESEENSKFYIYSSKLLPTKNPRCDVFFVRSKGTTVLFDEKTGNFDVYETPKGIAYFWRPFERALVSLEAWWRGWTA